MEFINLKYQYELYQTEIDEAIKEVLKSGQYIMGESIMKLEETLADFIGSKHGLCTSSGTDSLLLALQSIGIKQNDEVICVPFTWVSPVEVIRRLGAKPVFVDIDPRTCLMDLDALEEAVSEKTKAIIAISLYGQMPDFNRINKIASVYNIPVIEDGAQSFGATQKGNYSCNVSTIGITSFFPTKVLGCYGDGGALFTNDSEIAYKVGALRVHGAPERYNHQYIGMNGRMDTLQAAILLAKFPFLSKELKMRQKISEYYNEHLKEDFITPYTREGNVNIYTQYILRSKYRDKVLVDLDANQIPYAIYYPICIHEQPAYKDLGYKRGDFPNAEMVADSIFSIPLHPWLMREEQDLIIKVLKESILEKV